MNDAAISRVQIDDRRLTLELTDGRFVSVPTEFYPTLALASDAERQHFEVFPLSVYWPDLDCDIGLEGVLQGARELPLYAQRAMARHERESAAMLHDRPPGGA